jgi:hypothetical protein
LGGPKEKSIGSTSNKQNIKILVFHLSLIEVGMVKIESLEMGKILSQKASLCSLA